MAVLNSAAGATTTSLHSAFDKNTRLPLKRRSVAVAALRALYISRIPSICCRSDIPAESRLIPTEHRWMYKGIRKLGSVHTRGLTIVCYRDGYGILDSKSKKTRPQVATGCAEAHTDCQFSHKIKEGDTLTSIANKYKVTVQSIALPNEISDVDYILAGKSLLIPIQNLKSGEVHANADGSSSLTNCHGSESQSVLVRTESSLSRSPVFASSFSFQTWNVRLALFLLLLFAVFTFVRRCISDIRTRKNKEVLSYQAEKEAQDAHHRPKLKRWQGILYDDRRFAEVDGDLHVDSQPALDAEEDKLRQSYAQLELVYAKFLADSGLSKSGYWRGGTPSALEDNK